MLVRKEVDKTIADHKVEGEEELLVGGVGAVGDPAAIDDLMLDIDGEGLIFSEDTFPFLPDFPCLPSPSATPSPSLASSDHAKNTVLSSCSSTSSSSSSSSWSFLQAPDDGGVAVMQQQQHHQQANGPPVVDETIMFPPPSLLDHHHSSEFFDGLDILGDINLFDLSVNAWDRSSLFQADKANMVIGGAAVANLEMQPCQPAQEGHLHGHGEGHLPCQQEEEEENNSSDELATIFLEWLRSNKDSISPEDLRNIKLKRATIESAACRLGRTKQGRMQLLKLILAWVQNNHLQRKQLQPPLPYEHQPRSFPVTSNPNQLDYNYSTTDSNIIPRYSSCIPYYVDSSTGTPHPASLMAYDSGGDCEMLYPGATAPYPFGTSSIVVNNQPFSPSPNFVDPTASPSPAQLATALPQFSPFPRTSNPHMPLSVVPPQIPGGFAMYHQGQPLSATALTTKEARRKRMARQRRLSSHHHQHNHSQPHLQPPSHHLVAFGSSHSDARNWAFWTSVQNSSNMQLAPPIAAQPQKKSQHGAVSSSMKRQGLKGENNLRFLLQKVLKQSDVGSLGRIVLPKKEAETHLPELAARDGISIPMEDIGTSQVWNMRYRFWPNNKSRMYLLENTGDFVRSNGLKEGDFIVIYSDAKWGKYIIRGVKVRQPMEARAASSRNAGKNI